MLPLPNTFPSDASSIVVGMIDGNIPFDKAAFADAAWNLQGYGLYATIQQPASSSPPATSAPMDAAAVSRELTSKGPGAVDWASILQALTALALQFMKSPPVTKKNP